jgi:uncharacterized membrane protein
MTSSRILAGERTNQPVVCKITNADLLAAFVNGCLDFWEAPTHMVFLSLIYPAVGLFAGRLLIGADVAPMLAPLAVGFALIGPFAAVGLFEFSRRRERGLPVSWRHAFGIWQSPSRDALLGLGAVLTLLFLAWMASARAIYLSFLGDVEAETSADVAQILFATPAGVTMLLVGSVVGLVFAAAALTLGVVSIPLLLDRPVGVATAIDTSVRAVMANPGTMALWGAMVATVLAVGALPALIGLSVVMPVLAHASWHLYRRVVLP